MCRLVSHIVIYTICIAFFASCDLFEPRTPEEPTGARGSFLPPTEPDIVIDNFINAINERNSQHYIQSFVDPVTSDKEFEFRPTQSAQSTFGLFDEWTVQDERSYLENIISSIPGNATLSLTLANRTFEGETSTEAFFTATYRLRADHTNDGFPHTVFEGTLRFEMSTDDANNWAIHLWGDFSSDEAASWSDLKATFR